MRGGLNARSTSDRPVYLVITMATTRFTRECKVLVKENKVTGIRYSWLEKLPTSI